MTICILTVIYLNSAMFIDLPMSGQRTRLWTFMLGLFLGAELRSSYLSYLQLYLYTQTHNGLLAMYI